MTTNTPTNYDPLMLNHWLWFKYKCHECSPTDFEILFGNIIVKTKPEFIKVRPYGKIGDRKCDGLFYADGSSTIFQVYSPDELKQSEVLAKIDEDLDGAVSHWGEKLKKWIFVFNARRGLAPDIPKKILEQKQLQYPAVKLDQWSNDRLWEMVRELDIQKRSEILGAPAGYEYLFFDSMPEADELKKRLKTDSFVLVQDLLTPVSLQHVSEAMAPARPLGAPFFIRPSFGENSWTKAALQQQSMVKEVLEKARNLIPRFSVFSFAPIPLVIHLGFLLSDRVEIRYFQFDRENLTWKWRSPKKIKPDDNIQTLGLPEMIIEDEIEVSVAVSLSANISPADIKAAAPNSNLTVSIFVDNPDILWLQGADQLKKLGQVFRQALSSLRAKIPNCRKIHLFYAGPTGGGIIIGQQINPRMNAPVDLYEFSFQSNPRYRYALTLTPELS